MPEFTRTVIQRYTVTDADMAAFEATALIEGIIEGLAEKVAKTGVKVGRPVIADTYGEQPGGEDALYAILGDAQIPERLLAWRDAAVRTALQAAGILPATTHERTEQP